MISFKWFVDNKWRFGIWNSVHLRRIHKSAVLVHRYLSLWLRDKPFMILQYLKTTDATGMQNANCNCKSWNSMFWEPNLTERHLDGSSPLYIMTKRKSTDCTATCHVCGDKASTHKHYGSRQKVCYSCRAFFRRCVKKRKIPMAILCKSYLIEAPGTCQIRPDTRSFCR